MSSLYRFIAFKSFDAILFDAATPLNTWKAECNDVLFERNNTSGVAIALLHTNIIKIGSNVQRFIAFILIASAMVLEINIHLSLSRFVCISGVSMQTGSHGKI